MTTPWKSHAPPKNGKLRIGIAIPYKDSWAPEFAERMLFPLKQQPPWCEKVLIYSRAPSISVARDSLVKQALEGDCDYILMVDSDMVLENPQDPNVALKILYDVSNKSKDKNDPHYKDARVVSGLYRAKQPPPSGFSYAMWLKQPNGYAPVSGWRGNWLVMDAIGLGFCLINMTVFKEIEPPWFNWNQKGDISEDFFFCERCKEKGFDVRVLTDIKLSHLGMLKVKCDGSIVTPDL